MFEHHLRAALLRALRGLHVGPGTTAYMWGGVGWGGVGWGGVGWGGVGWGGVGRVLSCGVGWIRVQVRVEGSGLGFLGSWWAHCRSLLVRVGCGGRG